MERLHDACASGDLDAVADAVTAHPDPTNACSATDDDGQNALHHACSGGDALVVRFILERTPPGTVNIRDMHDMSPFHLACESGHVEVVALLASREDLDRSLRATRRTSYFLAAKHESAAVCELLERLEREDEARQKK